MQEMSIPTALHKSIINSLATRSLVAQYLKKRYPNWQAIMSQDGYSLLLDALSTQLIRDRVFRELEAIKWFDAIHKYGKLRQTCRTLQTVQVLKTPHIRKKTSANGSLSIST